MPRPYVVLDRGERDRLGRVENGERREGGPVNQLLTKFIDFTLPGVYLTN